MKNPKRGKAKSDPNRDSLGRFVRGHRAPGPGNLRQTELAQVRKALRAVVRPEDVETAWRKLVELASDGDGLAAREVLDRTIGRGPIPSDMISNFDLASSKGCIEAIAGAAKAVAAGDMTTDEAEALTRIAARAARVLEAQALGGGEGVGVLLAPAAMSPEEWLARVRGTTETEAAGGVIPSPPEPAGDVPPRE